MAARLASTQLESDRNRPRAPRRRSRLVRRHVANVNQASSILVVCSDDVQLWERSALQTRTGADRNRSTSPRSGPGNWARRLLPACCAARLRTGPPCRVRLLARSAPSQGAGARSILARGATSLPADPAASLRTKLAEVRLLPGTPCSRQGIWRRRSERRASRFDSERGRREDRATAQLVGLITRSEREPGSTPGLATPTTLRSGRAFIRRSKRARLPRSARRNDGPRLATRTSERRFACADSANARPSSPASRCFAGRAGVGATSTRESKPTRRRSNSCGNHSGIV